MNYHEAPNRKLNHIQRDDSLFLAGSISGAFDWQKDVANNLIQYYHIFNPRRVDYNIEDRAMEVTQITWEYDHLKFCKHIMFFFAPETLAPITLFEYGAMLVENSTRFKTVWVCIHPDYKRKRDVEIQTHLRGMPIAEGKFFYNLDEMVKTMIKFRS